MNKNNAKRGAFTPLLFNFQYLLHLLPRHKVLRLHPEPLQGMPDRGTAAAEMLRNPLCCPEVLNQLIRVTVSRLFDAAFFRAADQKTRRADKFPSKLPQSPFKD